MYEKETGADHRLCKERAFRPEKEPLTTAWDEYYIASQVVDGAGTI